MHNNDHARVARHIDAMLYKKAAAHAQSQAFQRYDQAGLQALQRAMVPPCLARSMWASMHRQGWRPGVEAQMRIHDVHPDDEPRKLRDPVGGRYDGAGPAYARRCTGGVLPRLPRVVRRVTNVRSTTTRV